MVRNLEVEAIFADYIRELEADDLQSVVRDLPPEVRGRLVASDIIAGRANTTLEDDQRMLSHLAARLSEKHGTEVECCAAGPWVWESADHASRSYLGVPGVLSSIRACEITRTDEGTWIPSIGDPSYPNEMFGPQDLPDAPTWEGAMRACDAYLRDEDPEFVLSGEAPYPSPPAEVEVPPADPE